MFTGQRRGEFLSFLTSVLAPDAGAEAADDLLNAAIKPSKQLLDLAAEEIQHREQFVLIDQQQVAYSMVMRAVERARAATTKEVVIVTGGPGSGKSVIALSLLGELTRQGRTALHATGSSAFTQTMRKVAGTAGAASQEPVQVLQPVHRRREERHRRSHQRRGTPRPGDLDQPIHPCQHAHGPASGRGAHRRRPGAGVPARRAPGRAIRGSGAASTTSRRPRRGWGARSSRST